MAVNRVFAQGTRGEAGQSRRQARGARTRSKPPLHDLTAVASIVLLATTNLAFLICQRALLAFNVGSASAAGVLAIVLANIVAFFLVRTVARRLEV